MIGFNYVSFLDAFCLWSQKETLKVINNLSEMLAWEKKPKWKKWKYRMFGTGLDSPSWVHVNALQHNSIKSQQYNSVVTIRTNVKHQSMPHYIFYTQTWLENGRCIMACRCNMTFLSPAVLSKGKKLTDWLHMKEMRYLKAFFKSDS